MLVGQLLSPHVGRDSGPTTASWARAWPVPPEGSLKAQVSPMPGGGGVGYGGWHFAPPHPRMKMMWVGSPALNEHVGIFSIVSASRNLPKGTASAWLEQVGEDLLMCPFQGGEGQE